MGKQIKCNHSIMIQKELSGPGHGRFQVMYYNEERDFHFKDAFVWV